MDRMLRSSGCRGQTMLKRRGCPVIVNDYRELSNMFITGFPIKLQLYVFKVVKEFCKKKVVKSNQRNHEIQRSVTI